MIKFTPEKIAELRGVCNAATPPPWASDDTVVWQRGEASGEGAFIADVCDPADGQFAVTAREALPDALDEIERSHAEAVAWREAVGQGNARLTKIGEAVLGSCTAETDFDRVVEGAVAMAEVIDNAETRLDELGIPAGDFAERFWHLAEKHEALESAHDEMASQVQNAHERMTQLDIAAGDFEDRFGDLCDKLEETQEESSTWEGTYAQEQQDRERVEDELLRALDEIKRLQAELRTSQDSEAKCVRAALDEVGALRLTVGQLDTELERVRAACDSALRSRDELRRFLVTFTSDLEDPADVKRAEALTDEQLTFDAALLISELGKMAKKRA